MIAGRRRQSGAALLIMMLVVLVAISAILVGRLNSANLSAMRSAKSTAALADAREALLDFAATEPNRVPGAPVRLPCPDLDASGGFADGVAHTSACGTRGVSVIGRLPWQTLGMRPPKDSASACLWYVVSGDYKAADTESAELLNPDTAGQLRLYDAETGALAEGATAADRPVALVLSPGEALSGQARAAADITGCSSTFDASDFLDDAASAGIDNAFISGVADGLDNFAFRSVASVSHNDRVAVIRQSDLARLANQRLDYSTNMRDLGLAVTACIAEYGRNNSGGTTDLRLPWPAPLALADYRSNAAYDDADTGVLSGRVPDVVDESSAASSNSLSTVLSACNSAAVPEWTVEMQARWRNYKDHLFYVVSDSFAPSAPVPTVCVDCLTVNGIGAHAAVVAFANPALSGQTRTMPPNDADARQDVSNYLEGLNAAAFPYSAGALDLESGAVGATFNDMLFCIAEDLSVSTC